MRFKKNHTFFHRLPPVNIKLSRYIPLSNVRGRFDKNVVANFEKVHVPLSLDSLCFVFFFLFIIIIIFIHWTAIVLFVKSTTFFFFFFFFFFGWMSNTKNKKKK
jgi:hypothetical protein